MGRYRLIKMLKKLQHQLKVSQFFPLQVLKLWSIKNLLPVLRNHLSTTILEDKE